MIYSIFIFLYPHIITPYHIKISADLVLFHKVESYKDAPSDSMTIHIFHKKYQKTILNIVLYGKADIYAPHNRFPV